MLSANSKYPAQFPLPCTRTITPIELAEPPVPIVIDADWLFPSVGEAMPQIEVPPVPSKRFTLIWQAVAFPALANHVLVPSLALVDMGFESARTNVSVTKLVANPPPLDANGSLIHTHGGAA